jgi:hypothetical protein
MTTSTGQSVQPGRQIHVTAGGAHLVDAREAALEASPGGSQVQAPHAHSLGAAEAHRFVEVGVEVARPVAQRLGVVAREALDVVAGSPARSNAWMMRDTCSGAASGTRSAPRTGRPRVAWRSRAMPWLRSRPPAPAARRSARGVRVDVRAADVLDHADRGDLVERLAAQLAPVHDSDVDAVADALLGRAPARELGLRLESVMPVTCAPREAARRVKLPQPQPTSSTRSPSPIASLSATSSSLTFWASSSVLAPREKIAHE